MSLREHKKQGFTAIPYLGFATSCSGGFNRRSGVFLMIFAASAVKTAATTGSKTLIFAKYGIAEGFTHYYKHFDLNRSIG